MAQIRLSLDPWPAEYESSFQIEEFEEEKVKIHTDVEGAWQAIEPETAEQPGVLCFIDGVRRVEARVIIDDGSGRIIRGLFGSAAVGAVRIQEKIPTFEQIRVRRLLVAGTGLLADSETLAIGNLTWSLSQFRSRTLHRLGRWPDFRTL